MIGHAAAAEWLRTLPWWDWRGWSDWFYGGQAIGVNYPPLGHAWMRFTHPVHGQMAAVAIGLLVLLPWGALRLAKAVGYSPRGQRAAVAGAFVLTAASGGMHWVLSGFHANATFFGSWPAMIATVLGLHAASGAARCRGAVAAGTIIGIAALFNATIIPGVAVVCVALLSSSGAGFSTAIRWLVTAASASIAVTAWWLVPFADGHERLVSWTVTLSDSWGFGGTWQTAMLALVGVAAAWAARRGPTSSRRLAAAALAGLGATLLADLVGYLRPERWMELPLLVAAIAAVGLIASHESESVNSVKPAWLVLGTAFLIVLAVVTLRVELVPLAAWLALRRPLRARAWGGALGWAAILLFAPPWTAFSNSGPTVPPAATPSEVVRAQSEPTAEGLVYVESSFQTASGTTRQCEWGNPWIVTASTEGRVRPLHGLYRETTATAEFLDVSSYRSHELLEESSVARPHWFAAWNRAGSPRLDTPSAARALGAKWFASCDAGGNVSIVELSAIMARGLTVAPYPDETTWHRAAAKWWIAAASNTSVNERDHDISHRVPVLTRGVSDTQPLDQAASGLSLHTAQDRLTLTARQSGWAWIRVPWDPYWHAENGVPVLKGGPGHLVVWAEPGITELSWAVPSKVDGAAASVSSIALLTTAALAIINRRRGFPTDLDRPLPVSGAVRVFVDTVDGWAHTLVRSARRWTTRSD